MPLVLLLVFAGGYSLLAWWASTRVPAELDVAGVDISGLSERAARNALEDHLVPRTELPLSVSVAGTQHQLSPRAAGLSIDVDATVDEVMGFSWRPEVIRRQFEGGSTIPPVTSVESSELRAALSELATSVDAERIDGSVVFDGVVAVSSDAVTGIRLDVRGAADVVRRDWLLRQGAMELPTEVTEPDVTQAEVDQVMADFALPATAGPVVVDVPPKTVTLPLEAFVPALSVTSTDGQLVPAVDAELLRTALLTADPSLETQAKDAGIVFKDGRPTIVPAVPGARVDTAQVGAAVQAAFTAEGRTATVAPVVLEPAVTTAQVEALGVREVVSEFATNLTPDLERTENVRLAAGAVNGTLLKPGETFSLNETLGRRTPDKGYDEAPVIMDGRLTPGMGGGVSQVATTLFNGMFFAGLKDVYHQPHSFYISRYPEGREATVNFPTVDLKFENDTKQGVFIEMWLADGQVHTRFWGTRAWDVSAIQGARTNILEPGPDVIGFGEDCVDQSPQIGFDVTVTRVFAQGGVEQRREDFVTRYNPEERVTCTGIG